MMRGLVVHRSSFLMLFLLVSHVRPSWAFVPPKPGSDLEATYEPVHMYRRHRNITFDYRPRAIHPEMCRYLSEAQCRDADESMQRHQQRHRRIQNKLFQDRTRRLDQDAANTTQEEELQDHMAEFRRVLAQVTSHLETWQQPTRQEELEELQELLRWDDERQRQNGRRLANPRLGQFRVLLLLMRFSDHGGRPLPDKYEYQILWNLRIRKWLAQNSYGKYDAFFEVMDWKQTDNTENHYAFGQSGRVAEFQNSYWPLLSALDNDPNWDWSPYDIDGDGFLDNLIVLHSGYAAEEGGADCTNGREYLDRIWSHAFSDSKGWQNKDGTMKVEGYMIASALDLVCDYAPAKMGIMTHEYLHTFYLIDLYDYTFEGKGIGNFDIMAYPYGFSNDGYIPVSLGVWGKTSIEWLECPQKTTSGTYTLEPIVSSPNGCIKINLQGEDSFEEYLLLENRQQMGFDVDFWIDGVVIYHIDMGANEQYDRGFPGQPGWPGNGKHYMVAVLPADKLYELEQNINNGDAADMWVPGMSIGPNYDGNTYPNTDMYQGGAIVNAGVTIEILEQIGNNFNVKITMPTRSGGANENESSGALPTPMKAQSTAVDTIAAEQFRTPDAEEFRMSGKVPQLPWFQEALAARAAVEKPADASGACRKWSRWTRIAAFGSAILGAMAI